MQSGPLSRHLSVDNSSLPPFFVRKPIKFCLPGFELFSLSASLMHSVQFVYTICLLEKKLARRFFISFTYVLMYLHISLTYVHS